MDPQMLNDVVWRRCSISQNGGALQNHRARGKHMWWQKQVRQYKDEGLLRHNEKFPKMPLGRLTGSFVNCKHARQGTSARVLKRSKARSEKLGGEIWRWMHPYELLQFLQSVFIGTCIAGNEAHALNGTAVDGGCGAFGA